MNGDDGELSDADAEIAIEALTLVLSAISKQRDAHSGHGFIACPKCHHTITFTFQRFPKRSRSLNYTAICETPHCIRFTGH